MPPIVCQDEFVADVDLVHYRARVDTLADRVGRHEVALASTAAAEDDVLVDVLTHHPLGLEHALTQLDAELAAHSPNGPSSAVDVRSMTRVYLLHQIDVLWWGSAPAYETSADVEGAADLVDLEALRRTGHLRFSYRKQAATLPSRIVRAADRRFRPNRGPGGAGLRFCRARPEAVAFLNSVAGELRQRDDRGSAALWLSSAVRSVEHQEHLRTLGYSALYPSSHCSGYALDVPLRWLRPRGTDTVLAEVLIGRRNAGEINVIDEGPSWHVCLSPSSLPALAALYAETV